MTTVSTDTCSHYDHAGPPQSRSQMSLYRLGLLPITKPLLLRNRGWVCRQSVTKAVLFPVALAGVISVAKEVWKSSKIELIVHNYFELVKYAGLNIIMREIK